MTTAAEASSPHQESLGYQVNHLARLLAHALGDRIAPLGVVPGQFAQLLALYEQDGLTQRELVERVRIEQATMANTLQRMERDGLIRRTPTPRTVAAATRGLSQQEVTEYLSYKTKRRMGWRSARSAGSADRSR